jgi:hypothetical protein
MKKTYSRNKDAKILFVKMKQIPKNFLEKNLLINISKTALITISFIKNTVNPKNFGTKAAFVIDTEIEAGETKTFDFRLSPHKMENAFFDFDEIFEIRKKKPMNFMQKFKKILLKTKKCATTSFCRITLE